MRKYTPYPNNVAQEEESLMTFFRFAECYFKQHRPSPYSHILEHIHANDVTK